jgi:hypothetical protein
MNTLSSASTVKREPSLVTSTLNDEVVMMDAESGTYYGLNDTASSIWNLLAEARSVETIIDQLVEIYEVERFECEHDVLAALEDMRQRGLIEVVA